MRIFITQLIYIKPGAEKIFDEFESVAIPIISRYNGKLLMRVRPAADSFVEVAIERPYEIHLVEFDSDEDFQHFMKDETRKQFLHLKEASIQSSILYKGTRL
jgi:uncharacterized protein (DUF1330 family)